ncbi:MAG: hypothetical protein HY866_01895, partial [Chloroflexi bacterium]|nr:hypothetical protein [Chloroflexota bacterium]
MPHGCPLDSTRGLKPLDFGCEGVTGSVDAHGRLIVLNTYHPQHGYVTLTTADPFPEDQRYNPAAVRAYRAGLARLSGFGPQANHSVVRREAALLAGAIPSVKTVFEHGTQTEMIAWAHGGGAFQQWKISEKSRWRGRLSLQRCAYTQLTEGGPVPMPPIETLARLADGVLAIENPMLEWAAAIAGFPAGEHWERRAAGPIEIDIAGEGESTTLVYGFGPTAAAAQDAARRLALNPLADLDSEMDRWQQVLGNLASSHLAVQRGISYGLMLAVPVGETRCILTDHMLLPLSWNRDAYYVARTLLDRQPDLVRRHLLWLFEVAQRSSGAWGRCYLANGRIKDAAFQLDQQLYPLLELAEYVQATQDHTTWERLRPAIMPVITTLLDRKAAHGWLFPTDETPADDPLTLPYHFSSHILMWFTLRKIASLLNDPRLSDTAEAVRGAAREHFTVNKDGQTLFAYATDGAGNFHLYHDAN